MDIFFQGHGDNRCCFYWVNKLCLLSNGSDCADTDPLHLFLKLQFQKKCKGVSRTESISPTGESSAAGPEKTWYLMNGGQFFFVATFQGFFSPPCGWFISPGSFFTFDLPMSVKISTYSTVLSYLRNMDQSSPSIWDLKKWWYWQDTGQWRRHLLIACLHVKTRLLRNVNTYWYFQEI